MNETEFEQNNLDILQNIEAPIAACYRADPSLTDYAVMAVLEWLINQYAGQTTGRFLRPSKLSLQEQALFNNVKKICEWRLGRGHPEGYPDLGEDLNTGEEITSGLKKILKSAKSWNREGGRQGYLNYIIQFLP